LPANVDLALAVLTVSSGMSASAGETVFAVARTAGWITHTLEEYQERPLRMRPSGHYVGARPYIATPRVSSERPTALRMRPKCAPYAPPEVTPGEVRLGSPL
jgi:hypothetical protein